MNKNSFLIGILTLIIGILILLAQDAFIKFAIIILGIAAIISGVSAMISAHSQTRDTVYTNITFLRGVLSTIVGLAAVSSPLYLAETMFNAVTYILGIYFLISAFMQIFTTLRLYKNGIQIKNSLIEILTAFILAAFLFMMNFKAFKTVIFIIALLLILAGSAIIFLQWKKRPLVINPDSVETIDNATADENRKDEDDK
nr:DUF308 domain-containing protein [Treponema zioleckii]